MVERRNYIARILHSASVAWTYLFLYLPIIILVLFSFNESAEGVSWQGFSFRWYGKLLQTPEILDALQTSLVVAFATTILSVSLGTLLVMATTWWKSPVLFYGFFANIFIPEIILAVGVLSMVTFCGIPLGYASLIAGHTLLGLGFVIPIVRARFTELDPVLTEASLDLGANYQQTFVRVILPLLMPSLVAASLLVFTLSMDDFFISFFCAGPTAQTLAVYVFSMLTVSLDPTINAISTVFLLLSSVLIIALSALKILDQVIAYEE